MLQTELPKANVLGVGVHAIDMPRALEALEQAVAERRSAYVTVTGVHGVMEAQDDPAFLSILNSAYLTVPDGMPTVWVGRLQGHREMRRVYGPDLMMEVCRRSVSSGRSHFLYGGKPGVAERLADVLRGKFPGIRVVGCYCPPFRSLTSEESEDLRRQVEQADPDYMWVGLSTPKQERFMAEQLGRMKVRAMIGV